MDFAIDRKPIFSKWADIYSENNDDQDIQEENGDSSDVFAESYATKDAAHSRARQIAAVHRTAFHGDIRPLLYNDKSLSYPMHREMRRYGPKVVTVKALPHFGGMHALEKGFYGPLQSDQLSNILGKEIATQLDEPVGKLRSATDNVERNSQEQWGKRISRSRLLKASVITVALGLPISATVASFSIAGLVWSLSTSNLFMTSFFALMSVIFISVGRYSYNEMKANKITYGVLTK